ncbi:hypothetical protein CLOACE_06000 [Clostridium acetireducens DSM 10703]|uniref:ABC-transporter type IV n=1 Tax=Clostridium acetireducens DSM 10703 TaxID=1121290 RepID=A0A1E8F1F6_9CLOT|nr:putative ABC transporter permease [Clostridium acetireducens]OFI07014.1 hypothetical protein CLOACE_06000 [Clostridium acetireducens DSM 10703]
MYYNVFSYNFYNLLFYFIVYSFLGWCLETIYATIKNKNFINRGFLFGPFCPMYGFGALSIIIFLKPFRNSILFLFIFSIILTSILEYLTGYILEKFFHTVWWDYSDNFLNIKGRICLSFSLLWGILSVFFIYEIHPFFINLTNFIHKKYILILLNTFLLYFIIDFSMTLIHLSKLSSLIEQLSELSLEFKYRIENIKDNSLEKQKHIESIYKEIKSRYEFIFNKTYKKYSRFFKAFPGVLVYKAEIIKSEIKNKLLKSIKKNNLGE